MLELTKEEFDRLEPATNRVLVQMIKKRGDKHTAFDNVKTIKGADGDIQIELDITYESNWKVDVKGKVVKVCKNLSFDELENNNFASPWDTDIEIQVGDIAYYEYTIVSRAFGIGNSDQMYTPISCEGNLYLLMRYHDIYLVVRDGSIIPINGYVIGKRNTENKLESDFLIQVNLPKVENIITVKCAGKPNRAYRGYTHAAAAKSKGPVIPTYDFTEHILVPGEEVYIDNRSNIFPIENDLNPTLEKGLVCTQRKFITAVKTI